MTALTTTNETTDLITFDDEKIGLIKRTIAKEATNDELELFLHQCKKTGLDPLAKQIYFQKYTTRNGPQIAIITGIDGYRLVASRTGLYAGSDEPKFEGRQQHSGKTVPAKATVTVWRLVKGKRCPFSASVYWDEYVPSAPKDFQWKKMPHVMLAKCAEASALRKAFPADLSGVYTQEEMQQADWAEVDRPSVTVAIEPETTVIDIDPEPEPAQNDDAFIAWYKALPDGAKSAYKAENEGDFIEAISYIERYGDNPNAAKNAVAKFVSLSQIDFTPKDRDAAKIRVMYWQRVAAYAALRDGGMESAKAQSGALSQVQSA